MEDTRLSLRDTALTAIAPAAWATTYLITARWLPEDRPFFSAAIRALPIGLVMLAWRRQLPRGEWWWKAALLGVLNIGGFFALLFVAAYRLPGGLASTLQATSPLAVIALAFVLVGERPRLTAVVGSVLGLVGVAVLVLRAGFVVDLVGVAAALGSVAMSGVGFVLVKRWTPPVDLLTLTSWQLVAGGLFLVPVAYLAEGAPPHIDLAAGISYLWLAVVGTGVAYVVWFRGLRRLNAASVATLGLVNPVAATVLGIAFMGEVFGVGQAVGVTLVLVGVLLGQPAVVQSFRRRWAFAVRRSS